jgi:hypothetical protein
MVSMVAAQEFRANSNRLASLATDDLATYFDALDLARPESARDGLLEFVPALAQTWGDANAALAAEWYDDMRSTERVPGSFSARPADAASTTAVQSSTRALVGGLWTGETSGVLELLTGLLVRAVLLPGRDTITSSVAADPQGYGWQRIAHARSCDFCLMLADRGGVYRSEKTATFAAHGHCRCTAVPSWDPSAREVPAMAYRASDRMEKVRARAADPSDPKKQRQAQRVLDNHRDDVNRWLTNNTDLLDEMRADLVKAAA